MPYIEKPDRKSLESRLPLTPGELNYVLTVACNLYLNYHKLSYQTINDILGALEGAKQEFYRRVAVPYEDVKHKQNGDVYVDIINGLSLTPEPVPEPELPVVKLSGSGAWEQADKLGRYLDGKFPGNGAHDFAIAVEYNGCPFPALDGEVTRLEMVKEGAPDESEWLWEVTVRVDTQYTYWLARGSCDYTGWDCQSSLTWYKQT